MKTFTIASTFALLLSNVSAKWIRGQGVLEYSTALLEENEPLEFHFSDLTTYYFSWGNDPMDTVIVSVKTPPSKENQTIIFDVTPLRKVVKDIALSISGCDGNGVNCYPAIKDVKTSRPFDQDQLKNGNKAYLNLSTFASPGSPFFLYLQVQRNPGHENLARNSGAYDFGPAFNQVAHYNEKDAVAFTISLKTNVTKV